jgi:hypothetical protein
MKKIFAFVVVAMATVFSCVTSNAQEVKKESPWVEVQQVDIPAGQTVHEGVTKSGNPKYWFEFGELKVNVSPGSAIKYKEGATKLLLVKWQHKDTSKYKYSIRQKERAKKNTPNIDLNSLF